MCLIRNISSIDKRIHKHFLKRKNKIKDILKIVNNLKGKFMLLIEQSLTFKNDEFWSFYNFTKGKIDNIFNLKSQSNNELYLIRTKILKDLIDNENDFNNYKELIIYIEKMDKPKLNYIPIALCPNDKYTPLAYTSMISILISKNFYSYIDFYLIISKNYSDNNYILLESLFEQFYYFNITYIFIDDRYQNAFVHNYITNQAYFRFSLGNLLPNLNRIS